jgi:peptidoglycan/LPS O-acetylase OafA/YrhL
MLQAQIDRLIRRILIALPLLALLAVLTGFFQAPQPDEGTAAHIFQLSVVLSLAVGVLFVVTADWRQPRRNARLLTFPVVALLVAFAALYYLEHFYYPGQHR